MNARTRAIALSWLCAAPLAAGELLKPLDPADFPVNGFITGEQSLPSAAADGTDFFLLVWQSFGSPDDDDSAFSIQGQAFDALGAFVESQFQINTFVSGSQNLPRVAGLPEGFLVVWHSFGSPDDDADGASIQARYVTGPPVVKTFGDPAQFQVNEETTGHQLRPDVGTDAAGNAVVVWDDAGLSIEAVQIDSVGVVGSQFQVNTLSGGVQTNPSVAVARSGHFVVVWESGASGGDDNDGTSIQAQRFNANGTPFGSQFQVNEAITGDQTRPRAVFRDDEDYLIHWESDPPAETTPARSGTTEEKAIVAKPHVFTSNFLLDEVIVVDNVTAQSANFAALRDPVRAPGQSPPLASLAVASLPVDPPPGVALGGDASETFVRSWLVELEGTAVDEVAEVNTTYPGRQGDPAVAVSGNGRVLVAWTSTPPLSFELGAENGGERRSLGDVDTDAAIYARFLTLPIFLGNFESGDVGRWSTSAP